MDEAEVVVLGLVVVEVHERQRPPVTVLAQTATRADHPMGLVAVEETSRGSHGRGKQSELRRQKRKQHERRALCLHRSRWHSPPKTGVFGMTRVIVSAP